MGKPGAKRQWWWVGDPPGGIPRNIVQDPEIPYLDPVHDTDENCSRIVRVIVADYHPFWSREEPTFYMAALFEVRSGSYTRRHYWVQTAIGTRPRRSLRRVRQEGRQLAREHEACWVDGIGGIHLRQAVLLPSRPGERMGL